MFKKMVYKDMHNIYTFRLPVMRNLITSIWPILMGANLLMLRVMLVHCNNIVNFVSIKFYKMNNLKPSK